MVEIGSNPNICSKLVPFCFLVIFLLGTTIDFIDLLSGCCSEITSRSGENVGGGKGGGRSKHDKRRFCMLKMREYHDKGASTFLF